MFLWFILIIDSRTSSNTNIQNFEINQNERSSISKYNSSSFIIANLTIVTIVVMTVARSSNSKVL